MSRRKCWAKFERHDFVSGALIPRSVPRRAPAFPALRIALGLFVLKAAAGLAFMPGSSSRISAVRARDSFPPTACSRAPGAPASTRASDSSCSARLGVARAIARARRDRRREDKRFPQRRRGWRAVASAVADASARPAARREHDHDALRRYDVRAARRTAVAACGAARPIPWQRDRIDGAAQSSRPTSTCSVPRELHVLGPQPRC